jgi:chromosomal replication initiator protein
MNTWDYSIFWKEALTQIRTEIAEQEFAMWFNLEYLGASETDLNVAVPSTFYRDQFKQRYQSLTEKKLLDLTGKELHLVLTVQPRSQAMVEPAPASAGRSDSMGGATPAAAEKKSVNIVRRSEEKPRSEKGSHGQLNKDYTFENFVIGENNNFAANAALAIAKNPGTAYNPFLIYGGVGLGKTHLMQAIGNRIWAEQDAKVIYIPAESFTSEFINALQFKQTAAFKNKYRYADVLLIDDIQILEKKPETQEELFHTFNALYDAKKQMVFTSDRHVSEIKTLTERLRSRFERGLNVDLQPPNYETRFAILRKKIDARGIAIPDPVIELVSKNVTTNVRDLEAALTKLFAYADIVKKEITLEVAQQQLKDVFASPRLSNMSIEVIQRVVSNAYSLSFNDLKGKKRTKNIAFPRQLAMYIARDITEYSTTEVGVEFGGRDHTTVMHACQKIEDMLKADSTLDERIKTLIRSIKEYSAKS